MSPSPDERTRELERRLLAHSDPALVVRLARELGRVRGPLSSRENQETLYDQLRHFDAATTARTLLDALALEHDYRKFRVGEHEILEFSFVHSEFVWVLWCWQARYDDGCYRVTSGRRLDIDVFCGDAHRRYENASTRTVIRQIAEPPRELEIMEHVNDPRDDPDFHAFTTELLELGADVTRVSETDGMFDVQYRRRWVHAAWNQSDPDRFGPGAELWVRSRAGLRAVLPPGGAPAFTHPRDLLDAVATR